MPRGRPKGSFKTDANERHPLYRTWQGMRLRCNNPNDKHYLWYGGRGIKVCERWNDFRSFVADMGPKPSWKYTVERIDNNGDYDPFNCIWGTHEQQGVNKRGVRLLTYQNETLTISQWARKFNMPYSLLWSRLQRMGISEALEYVPNPDNPPE